MQSRYYRPPEVLLGYPYPSHVLSFYLGWDCQFVIDSLITFLNLDDSIVTEYESSIYISTSAYCITIAPKLVDIEGFSSVYCMTSLQIDCE